MYQEISNNIRVSVLPVFIDERSDPVNNHYFWAYRVEIENLGQQKVQLINRYWKITDGIGQQEEVHGPGVVGEQPVLVPGEVYQYTSGCPLSTPSGFMQGHYEMADHKGERFIAKIPIFSLDLPGQDQVVN